MRLKNFKYRVSPRGFEATVDHLEVSSGQCVGLVGRNGSGKSTFLRALAGQTHTRSEDDTISIAAEVRYISPAFMANLPRHIKVRDFLGALIGEAQSLLDLAKPYHILTDFRDPRLWPDDATAAVAKELVERLDESILRRLLGDLSSGQQQMIGVLAVLLAGGSVCAVDEITSNLDPVWSRVAARLLKRRATMQHQIMLIASHDLEIVAQFSDRCLIALNNNGGRGSVEEITPWPSGVTERVQRLRGALEEPLQSSS